MTCMSFLVPVRERWLWMAPLHGAAAFVNDAAARSLRTGDEEDCAADVAPLKAIAHEPCAEPCPIVGSLVPPTLGIIPTRGCNMHCVYCDFAGSAAKGTQMSEGVARTVIDWAAERCAGAGMETLHVQFFGGEPFTAGERVEFVVRHARKAAAARGLACYVDASTNGLFNEEQCRYIGDNLDAVVLSIDGPPAFQDRYRPLAGGRGSSQRVHRNAHALARMPVELCLRMCVTHESVHTMAANAHWLMETFHPQALNFESLTASELAVSAGLAPPDPYEFAVQADRIFTLAAERGVDAVYAATETGAPRLSLCPVGRDVVIASPDGRLSGCYLMPADWQRKGMDLDFGQVEPGRGVTIDEPALARLRALAADKPRCRTCFCRFTCAGGCHVNLAGQPPGEYSAYCLQTRLITATRMLRHLGLDEEASALLADTDALRRLAAWPDDRIDAPLASLPCAVATGGAQGASEPAARSAACAS